MDDLDAALNELGMLSNVTKYRLEYLQNVEANAEAKKAAALKSSTASDDVTISVNSNFVTNINISTKYKNYNSARVELEIQEKRLSNHICDQRHSCPSSHICSFVSPRRSRIVNRASPYSSVRVPPISLRPASLPGVLISSRTRSLGRLRGPVRFYEPQKESPRGKSSSLYPLDEDLTSRLSAIQLTSITGHSNDSLNHSVDSTNSTDSTDCVRDLSWDVSRLEIEKQENQSMHS